MLWNKECYELKSVLWGEEFYELKNEFLWGEELYELKNIQQQPYSSSTQKIVEPV